MLVFVIIFFFVGLGSCCCGDGGININCCWLIWISIGVDVIVGIKGYCEKRVSFLFEVVFMFFYSNCNYFVVGFVIGFIVYFI